MCKWCEDPDGPMGCPDCGALICLEVKTGDDVIRPAYITDSGDVYCDICGPGYDEEDEEDYGLASYYYDLDHEAEMDLGGKEE